jgi:hypothetical protein
MRMFGRLFWFALGAAAGYAVTVRVQRLATAADRIRPARMREEIVDTVKSAASQVRDVVKDLAGEGVAS